MSEEQERRRRVIEQVRALSVVDLLDRNGVSHRRGQGWTCPVCGLAKRDNGCGVLRRDACRWHCFACGEGGTCVDLWLLWRGLRADRLDDAAFEALEELVGGQRCEVAAVQEEARALLSRAQVQAYWKLCQPPGHPAVRWWLRSRGLPEWLEGRIGVVAREGALPVQRRGLWEGQALVALPLWSTRPGGEGVANYVVRGSSRAKSVTINTGAGTTRDEGWPLCYGDPERARGGGDVVVVEGGPDWLTAGVLWPDATVVGAYCADDLVLWPQFLRECPGRITFVPHLDGLQWRCLACRGGWRKLTKFPTYGGRCPLCLGEVERRRPGIAAMEGCMQVLGRGEWFPWRAVLERLGIGLDRFLARGSTDLNDLVRPDGWGVPIGRVMG